MLIARDLAYALDPVTFARDSGVEPDPWQAKFLRNAPRRGLILATRQSGKTETCVLHANHVAHTEPGETIIVISPAQRISSEFIRRARDRYLRIEGAKIPGDAVQRIEIENGSRIIGLPGDNDGDTIRGIARVRLVLVDEAARVSDATYAAVRPMLAVHPRGALIGLTTGAAKRGWFFNGWADPDSDFEKIRVTADMCPRLTPEFLASERKALGETAFRTEYGLEFLDDQEAAFPNTVIDSIFDKDLRPLWT
jgi:hypothetical protein